MITQLKNIFRDKEILILGFGKEGQSTYRLIRKLFPDYILTIADRDTTVALNNITKNDIHVKYLLGYKYLCCLKNYNLIIKSPGISLKAIKGDISLLNLTSQTDIFLKLFSRQTIGVTGTKGKSTTASLIYHIIKSSSNDVVLTGNIGMPPFDCLPDIGAATKIVFEISSHQLEYCSNSPAVAILLNLFQEHLDHYSDFNAYQLAKLNINKFQQRGDIFIYNNDDNNIQALKYLFCKDASNYKFSLNEIKDNGCYLNNNSIININGKQIISFGDIKGKSGLYGEHNMMNIMASVIACNYAGIDYDTIHNSLGTFKGLRHRLEYLGEKDNVFYYNDSIATIPEATIEAVKALKTVNTLILGGYDRGIDYSGLVDFLSVSGEMNLIFVGKAGERIRGLFSKNKIGSKKCFSVDKFSDIYDIIIKHTKKGSVCLLSPAAASYDEFGNFEVRGNKFREMIFDDKKKA